MRFRGMIVGGLDGREDPGPAMAVVEEMRDPAPRFPGRDAELHVVARRELGKKLGRALEQRLAVGRIGAQALEGGLVALGKALGRAVGSEHAERLEERQPDDRERALAARRLEAVRPEGRALRRDNQILAVDERAVDVEHDELQRGFSGSETGDHYLPPRPRRRNSASRSLVIPDGPAGAMRSEPEGLLGRAAAEIRIEGLDGRFVVSPFGSDVPIVARLLFQIFGRFGAVFEIVHEIPHPQRFVS